MVRPTFKRQYSVSSFRREQEYGCFHFLLKYFRKSSEDDKEFNRPEIVRAASSYRNTDVFDNTGQKISELFLDVDGQISPLGITLTSRPYTQQNQLMKCHHKLTLNDDSHIGELIKIKDDDELILIQGIFLPCKTHDEVLELIKELTVDGETLNKLVVRRYNRSNKLKWYELFTILTPDSDAVKGVKVSRQEKHKLKKKDILIKVEESVHRYKIPGTQRYMVVDDTGLRTSPMYDDNRDDSTLMIKTTRMCVDSGNTREDICFYASLRDQRRERYITVDKNSGTLILSDTPEWFEFGQSGNKTRFVVKGTNLHLAFDDANDDIRTSKTEFMFDEFSLRMN